MNKKGTILCTALLLSSSLVFADSDTSGQSDGASTTTNTSTGDTTTSTPSTNPTDPGSSNGTSMDSNDGSSTDSGNSTSTDSGTTPSNDSQGSQTSTPTNNTDSTSTDDNDTTSTNVNDTSNVNTNINVDANITEVNNKAVIQGVTTAPTFTSVEFRDSVYYIPDTVTPVQGFYFLSVDSIERVCSLNKITKIKVLSTPTSIQVMIGNKKQVLYCYERSYFNF